MGLYPCVHMQLGLCYSLCCGSTATVQSTQFGLSVMRSFSAKTFCSLFFPLQGKVLGNLQLNLLSKSKVYEDPALSAIFLHNNYNYILKSLEK